MRGTFANIRIRNQIAPGTEGGFTTFWPTEEVMSIYDAAMKYKESDTGVASIAAMRHARAAVVTASSDSMDFIAPIHTGEAICIEAYVTFARKTSMEVYVKVEAENLISGEKRLTATAYMTFVALNSEGKPTPVPKVIAETEEEKWQYVGAEERFQTRKKRTEERKKRQQNQ